MSIRREITVTRKGLPCPIDITYGTNMLPIEFVVTDFNIPEGATAKVFSMDGSKKVKNQSAIISRNVISFTPEIGLFEEGKNVLQLAVTHSGKNLFTFYQPVNGHYTMQFEGAQDLENDPTFAGMVMQMQQEIAEISETMNDYDRVYNTVSEMLSDKELKVESKVKTRGYYSVNDGGSANYTIKSSIDSKKPYETLSNGLYAILEMDGKTLNLQSVGVRCDGVLHTISEMMESVPEGYVETDSYDGYLIQKLIDDSTRYDGAIFGFYGTIVLNKTITISRSRMKFKGLYAFSKSVLKMQNTDSEVPMIVISKPDSMVGYVDFENILLRGIFENSLYSGTMVSIGKGTSYSVLGINFYKCDFSYCKRGISVDGGHYISSKLDNVDFTNCVEYGFYGKHEETQINELHFKNIGGLNCGLEVNGNSYTTLTEGDWALMSISGCGNQILGFGATACTNGLVINEGAVNGLTLVGTYFEQNKVSDIAVKTTNYKNMEFLGVYTPNLLFDVSDDVLERCFVNNAIRNLVDKKLDKKSYPIGVIQYNSASQKIVDGANLVQKQYFDTSITELFSFDVNEIKKLTITFDYDMDEGSTEKPLFYKSLYDFAELPLLSNHLVKGDEYFETINISDDIKIESDKITILVENDYTNATVYSFVYLPKERVIGESLLTGITHGHKHLASAGISYADGVITITKSCSAYSFINNAIIEGGQSIFMTAINKSSGTEIGVFYFDYVNGTSETSGTATIVFDVTDSNKCPLYQQFVKKIGICTLNRKAGITISNVKVVAEQTSYSKEEIDKMFGTYVDDVAELLGGGI